MGYAPREWFSTDLFRAKRSLLANSPVFGTLASPKPAANAVQKGTLQPRANPSAASTVNSLAIVRTTVLCRPCVACAWLILTPPRSVLIFIITPMFFPSRFLPPVISKLLREGSKPRKPNAKKPRRNVLNARRTRNASRRRENGRERRKSAEREREERKKQERKERERKEKEKEDRTERERRDHEHLLNTRELFGLLSGNQSLKP